MNRRTLIAGASLLILSFSCEVQKRHYRKGFFVNRHEASAPCRFSDVTDLKIRSAHGEVPMTADHGNKIQVQLKKIGPPDTCDLLVFRNGDEVRVKLIEITPDEVKYRRCGVGVGPIYVCNKTQLFMVRYRNGNTELFHAETRQDGPMENPAVEPYAQDQQTHPSAALSLVTAIAGFVVPIGAAVYSELNAGNVLNPAAISMFVLLPVIALVLGVSAKKEIRAHGDRYSGSGYATTAIVFGIMQIVIWILVGLVMFLAI